MGLSLTAKTEISRGFCDLPRSLLRVCKPLFSRSLIAEGTPSALYDWTSQKRKGYRKRENFDNASTFGAKVDGLKDEDNQELPLEDVDAVTGASRLSSIRPASSAPAFFRMAVEDRNARSGN